MVPELLGHQRHDPPESNPLYDHPDGLADLLGIGLVAALERTREQGIRPGRCQRQFKRYFYENWRGHNHHSFLNYRKFRPYKHVVR